MIKKLLKRTAGFEVLEEVELPLDEVEINPRDLTPAELARLIGGTSQALRLTDRRHPHYRQAPRREVNLGVSLKVLLPDGTVYTRGWGRVVNLSWSGALLAEVALHKKSYPAEPFRLEMQVIRRGCKGIIMKGEPVRFDFARGGLGVRLTELGVKT